MTERVAIKPMSVFFVMWSGQLVSIVGSTMTGFALGVWVYEQTGSATKFALIYLFAMLPGILILPVAGALVDRWDRRWVIILSDLGSGISTLAIAFLLYTGQLQTWQIYIATGVKSAFSAFQWPAYIAASTLLVPQRYIGRANGLIQFNEAVAKILAPVLAVILVATIRIWGVLLIDFITFVFAILMALLIRIPKPVPTVESSTEKRSLWRETAYGWSYITGRPGLFVLLIFFTTTNFLTGMPIVLGTPLILSFASPAVLGTILSIGGCGMLMGSLVLSAWGGPKRRVIGVLSFELLAGLCIMVAGVRASAVMIAIPTFIFSFSIPIVLGSSQAIWQTKVAPDVQGRVFATRRMIAWSSLPIAYLLSGLLVDHVFNPLMAVGGLLSGTVGQVIGVGPGRGIGLLFIVVGFLTALAAAAGYLFPRLRLLEDELPDLMTSKVSA